MVCCVGTFFKLYGCRSSRSQIVYNYCFDIFNIFLHISKCNNSPTEVCERPRATHACTSTSVYDCDPTKTYIVAFHYATLAIYRDVAVPTEGLLSPAIGQLSHLTSLSLAGAPNQKVCDFYKFF